MARGPMSGVRKWARRDDGDVLRVSSSTEPGGVRLWQRWSPESRLLGKETFCVTLMSPLSTQRAELKPQCKRGQWRLAAGTGMSPMCHHGVFRVPNPALRGKTLSWQGGSWRCIPPPPDARGDAASTCSHPPHLWVTNLMLNRVEDTRLSPSARQHPREHRGCRVLFNTALGEPWGWHGLGTASSTQGSPPAPLGSPSWQTEPDTDRGFPIPWR